ncbi:alcohol dehydrogenase [Skermanella aerolata]|uniref:alcohol dehydrogenase n=1 Tax=Skermanella aerolata TaxID=393310 RepID=A0A512DVK7_9PROT|nr:zinc-dependent alcohol dehydrogenase family protein [Skermanella aerolata]KJB94455.1 alcohol dehydrogenase [Skermanella aerolata KACC 11604]GEO40503.1 alcohol dehydrogenase [Skermanella aerolata]
MKAMILKEQRTLLTLAEVPDPIPAPEQLLIRVHSCAVCRTDLHVIDGELPSPKLPLIPGHEIIGTVLAKGSAVDRFAPGDRVGVPWLGWTCGTCPWCLSGRENLCDSARYTGYQIDGGYAEMTVADARFCFPIAGSYLDDEAAPLMCAGLIGYRALRMAGDVERLGLYGFGAAAHIIAQVARHQGRDVYAFTRPGDAAAQRLALDLGASWAGGSDEQAPVLLDAAIIFAPAGALVPTALRAVAKGGTVVCAGIHMSDIPAFPYDILWGERVVRSVANLTRRDGEEFLTLAPTIPVRTHVTTFDLAQANDAIVALRSGTITGAAVLTL